MCALLGLQVMLWPTEIWSNKKENVCKEGRLVDMKGRRKPYNLFTYPHELKKVSKHHSEIPLVRSFIPLRAQFTSEKSQDKILTKKKFSLTLIGPNFQGALGQNKQNLCYKHDWIPAPCPSKQGLFGSVSSINMPSAFYEQKRWPIALPANRPSTQECFYKPAQNVASFLCSDLHQVTSKWSFSKDFANLLQNSCVMYFYQFCPNWHRLQTGLA